MQQIEYQDQERVRLDLFILGHFSERQLSRSYWANMIKFGYVQVNLREIKNGYKLSQGDVITIDWPVMTDQHSNDITTIYEDQNVEIINKPAAMLVHSKGRFNPEYTIADYIKPKYSVAIDEEINDRLGIVHRLDRYTTGVMILAKNLISMKALQKQFSERTVYKFYIAVCEGIINEPEINIDLPIARNPNKPKTFHVAKEGKEAFTKLYLIKTYDNKSLFLLAPKTGRTHQLRVHLSHINHPIVGDVSYGAKKSNISHGYLLHAYNLTLKLPGESNFQTFVAPIGDDMSSYIDEDARDAITKQIKSYLSSRIDS